MFFSILLSIYNWTFGSLGLFCDLKLYHGRSRIIEVGSRSHNFCKTADMWGLSAYLSWQVHNASTEPWYRNPAPYSLFSISGTWTCSRPSSRLAALWRSPLWEVGWTTARPWVNSLKLCWKLAAQRIFTAVKLFVCGSSSKILCENTRSLQTPGQFLVSRNSLLSSPIDGLMLEVFFFISYLYS